MTLTLDAPAGVTDVTLLEERQPDVPLTCTDTGNMFERPQCTRIARWEGMCMGCGRVFRRCQPHYEVEADEALKADDGIPFRCAMCFTDFYLDQFVPIG